MFARIGLELNHSEILTERQHGPFSLWETSRKSVQFRDAQDEASSWVYLGSAKSQSAWNHGMMRFKCEYIGVIGGSLHGNMTA